MHNPRSLLTASIFVFALVMGVGSFSTVSYFGGSIKNTKSIAALSEGTSVVIDPVPHAGSTPYTGTPDSEYESHLITARHVIRGTSHKVFGEADVDISCQALEVQSELEDTKPPLVELMFSTVVTASSHCLGIIEPKSFSVNFDAPEDVIIAATWNGNDAILSIIR